MTTHATCMNVYDDKLCVKRYSDVEPLANIDSAKLSSIRSREAYSPI